MSYSGISVNESDSVEQIVRRIKSLPNGMGWHLTPAMNKDLDGLWKPSQNEIIDLSMKVLMAMNKGEDVTIKDHVKGVVKFQYYRDSQLFYKTETGLVFPVPVEDIGNATFLAEDRAMLFMRYIRKFLESIKT